MSEYKDEVGPEALIEIDDADQDGEGDIVVVPKKNLLSANDGHEGTPLEDKHGRSLWIRTRMCFCPHDAETDCRFHSVKEKGWEQCPHLESAKKDSKMKGRWLWARNPLYGKPLTEEEEKEQEAQAIALASIEAAKKEPAVA